MQNNTQNENSQPIPAIVATDIVIFGIRNNTELVYAIIPLVTSAFPAGSYGLPGGLILKEETAEESVMRNVVGKTGITEPFFLEQLVTMSSLNRDPRNRVVSVAYLGLVPKSLIVNHSEVLWQSLKEDITLGFDHNEILAIAHKRLQDKIEYTTMIQYLLDETFTLAELQKAYETIRGKEIDKRNFRKKIAEACVLTEVGLEKNVSHRPASIYSFSSNTIKNASLFFI